MKHLKKYNEFITEGNNWKNRPRPMKQLFGMLPKTVDYRILEEMLTWGDYFKKSPYGHSYYSKEKTWQITIDKSYRMSDHWNFESRGNKFSITNQPVKNYTYWSIGRFDEKTRTWDIIMSYPFVEEPNQEENNSKIADIKDSYMKKYNSTINFEETKKDLNMLRGLMEESNLMAKIKNLGGEEYSGDVIRLKNKKMRLKFDNGKEMAFNFSRFTNPEIIFTNKKTGEIVFHKNKNSTIIGESEFNSPEFYTENFNYETELEKHFREGKYLYHYTLSDNMEEILEEGLIPRKNPNSFYQNGCQGVFLTTTSSFNKANLPQELIDEVDIYFESGDEDIEGHPLTQLKVNVENLDINKFHPDDDYLRRHKDEGDLPIGEQIINSLNYGWGVCYKGNIPKENIVGYTKDMGW